MSIQPHNPAFTIPVRIYYEDTDAGGIVYYANYLRFFERCRTEWLRQAGYNQGELNRETGMVFVVRKASCEYRKPARLDDLLTVGLRVERLSRVRVVFHQFVRLGDEELVTGTVEIASVNLQSMAPAPMPDHLFRQLETLK